MHFAKYAKKPFASKEHCDNFYNQTTEEFGTCGLQTGGGKEFWKARGCRSLNRKAPPCTGTFSDALVYLNAEKNTGFRTISYPL